MNGYKLIVAWENGERSEYLYETREAAEQGAENMEMALGEQIRWYGVGRC